MKPFYLGLVQSSWKADPAAMQAGLEKMVSEAAGQGAQIVCLQELTLSPYFPVEPQAQFEPEAIPEGPSCRFFSRLAETYGIYLVGSLFEAGEGGRRFNTAALFDPGGALVGKCRKQHIPWDIGYYERNYFEPGDSNYPVFDLPFVRLAMPTCYDQWFPEAARLYALHGAELIVYPTAIGSEPTDAAFDSQPAWVNIVRSHAIANNLYVAAVNRTGVESGLEFFGSSFAAGPGGEILAQAGRSEEQVLVIELDPEIMLKWRRLFPFFERREPGTYGEITKT